MFDLKRTLALIKGAIFDPDSTWESYLPDATDWRKTAALLTGPLVVASVVLDFVVDLVIPNRFAFVASPSVMNMLLGIVTAAIAAVVIAIVVAVLAGLFKGKNSFPLALAATSLAFVPGYVGRPLVHIPWVGWLLSLALGIYGLILLWRILPKYLDVPTSSRAGHYISSLVASVVALIAIGLIFGVSMMAPRSGTLDIAKDDNVFGGVASERMSGTPSGTLGQLERQGRIIESAEEDTFDPPGNGKLSRKQVQRFVDVLGKTRDYQSEQGEALARLSEKAENDEIASLGEAFSGMAGIVSISNAEMEVVKTGGGNWAEHQWVREQLHIARIQKDINDAVKHNYSLYLEFEDELRELGY